MEVLVDSEDGDLDFTLVVARVNAMNMWVTLKDFCERGSRSWSHVVVVGWHGWVSDCNGIVIFLGYREDTDVSVIVKKFCVNAHLMIKLVEVGLRQQEWDEQQVIVGVDGKVFEVGCCLFVFPRNVYAKNVDLKGQFSGRRYFQETPFRGDRNL